MATIPDFTPKTPKTRVYSDFRGVDFTSDSTRVSLYRSPNCVNMYKDYKSSLGQAVETRPGFINLLELENEIYGIHFIKRDSLKVLIHSGTDCCFGAIILANNQKKICKFYFPIWLKQNQELLYMIINYI